MPINYAEARNMVFHNAPLRVDDACMKTLTTSLLGPLSENISLVRVIRTLSGNGNAGSRRCRDKHSGNCI